MAKVLAGESGGSNGLKFMARNSTVLPANIKCRVMMDQSGSGVELRDEQNEKLFELDGRQLDELYAKNLLDVSRPDKLRDSVFKVWEKQRPPPTEPAVFVLDLTNIDPEQLKGRLKMLIDWLDEHVQNDVAVMPHTIQEQQPTPPPTQDQSQPQQSQPPQSPPASQPASQPQSAPPAEEEPKVAPTGEPMPEKKPEEEEEQPNEQPKPKAGSAP